MNTIYVITRFPEELAADTPVIVGDRNGKRAIAIHADIDGSRKISIDEAAQFIERDLLEVLARIDSTSECVINL